jgi:hypothetical protein
MRRDAVGKRRQKKIHRRDAKDAEEMKVEKHFPKGM